MLGHHYQREEVIAFADVTGDSFRLAQQAAAHPTAEFIVFCGVHFMAESADMLTPDHVAVILPDLSAGCSMADMAQYEVRPAWQALDAAGVAGTVPVTYVNSSAAIKAFGSPRRGRLQSSNAVGLRVGVRGGRIRCEEGGRAVKVLFLPDQHLGRNTAVRDRGLSCLPASCGRRPRGASPIRSSRLAGDPVARPLLGSRTLPADSVAEVRERSPRAHVLVHPECCYEVVDQADYVGSTEFIIKPVAAAPAGVLGGRDGGQPRQEAGAATPGQVDRLPRPDGLLLRDHEPHRPAPPDRIHCSRWPGVR